jgi:hypothetical protein
LFCARVGRDIDREILLPAPGQLGLGFLNIGHRQSDMGIGRVFAGAHRELVSPLYRHEVYLTSLADIHPSAKQIHVRTSSV